MFRLGLRLGLGPKFGLVFRLGLVLDLIMNLVLGVRFQVVVVLGPLRRKELLPIVPL